MPSELIRAQDVFTPGSFPTHTYVQRDEIRNEDQLRDGLETEGHIVTLSGPSKSGKTVLVERVVGADNLIAITGAGINGAADVWARALDWMGEPHEVSAGDSDASSTSGELRSSASIGALVAKGEVGGSIGHARSQDARIEARFARRGLAQIVHEIAGSDFVLLIDDFHYMDRRVQQEVAQELKEAVRQRVRIVVAAVPHRGDDVLRALSDLRGRITGIEVPYWDRASLVRIGRVGFDVLNLEVAEAQLATFADEATGSPQLMQAICLDASRELNFRTRPEERQLVSVSGDIERRIFERTVGSTDHRTLVNLLLSGPKTRGTDRLVFKFKDGRKGDVYHCVLRAIASNPARQSFHYNEINDRIDRICDGGRPVGSSVSGACTQMARIARNHLPGERVLDWDEETGVLEIPDPYLLFYLRWSGHA